MHYMRLNRIWYGTIAGVIIFGLIVGEGIHVYSQKLPMLIPAAKTGQVAVQNSPSVAWSPYGEQAITTVDYPALSANNGGNKALPIASVAKVMAALAILKQKPLKVGEQGPSMTIGADQVAVYQQDLAQNQSVVAVTGGEQLTEYQALEAMLIPSATNIADIAAPWAFGSTAAYLSYANQEAATLGMTNTHFADAGGFSPNTVSTPQDLLKLGTAAMANPVIAEIVAKPSVTLPVAGTVSNFNTALGQNGIVGIKTGNTDQAGGALLYASKYQGLTIIGVTLGAPDLGTAVHDSPEILGSFQQQLKQVTAVTAGQAMGTYRLPWGGSVQAVATNDLKVWGWADSKPQITITLKHIAATSNTKMVVGHVTVSGIPGQPAVSSNITLASNPSSPSFWWRLHR